MCLKKRWRGLSVVVGGAFVSAEGLVVWTVLEALVSDLFMNFYLGKDSLDVRHLSVSQRTRAEGEHLGM